MVIIGFSRNNRDVWSFYWTSKCKESNKTTGPKNVIMLVMDGSSDNAVSLARWYKGERLAMDQILTGAVTTYSAESAITDSSTSSNSFSNWT